MAENRFQDLTAEDFGEAPAKAPAGTNPATGKRFTGSELKQEMFGAPSKAAEIEPNPAKRFLAGAGRTFVNKYNGLTGQPAEPAYGLDEDLAGQLGGMTPDILGSVAAPARVLPQAAYGFATKAVEPADNLLERGVAGLKGGAEFGGGQLLASGLVRGANALGGRLTREGEAAAAAKGAGLNLTAGDISKSRLLQLAEEKSFGSPSAGQADEIAKIMNTEGGDPITLGIMNAYQNSQSKVAAAAGKLDDLVKTGNLPGVTPRKTYESIQAIAKRSPDTLKNVRDPELQAVLEEIASYPTGRIPKGMGFAQLDELRKALGPVMAKVEMQSKSGASNITTADANRWKQLYKGIMEDIDTWGAKSATEDALKAHKELSSTFKNEVLPLREHPVAGKVIDGRYERPEDLLRDLTSARNKSIINDLYGRLDQGGKNAFDALRLATRGSKEFVRGEPSSMWSRPLALTAGLTSPVWAPSAMSAAPWIAGTLAADQGLVHGLNTGIGRAMVSGSPQAVRSPLGNAAIYGGLRAAIPQGALRAIHGESEQ
jgi:hypothetical protein